MDGEALRTRPPRKIDHGLVGSLTEVGIMGADGVERFGSFEANQLVHPGGGCRTYAPAMATVLACGPFSPDSSAKRTSIPRSRR